MPQQIRPGFTIFSGLPTDQYNLKLFSPGFSSLTVKSIHISEGERKLLPLLELEVGSFADCGGHGVLDYIRFLPSGDHFGNLVGSIRIEQAPFVEKSRPISGAEVTLICDTGKVCGGMQTNLDGEFAFKALLPGNFSVHVDRTGFYPLIEPGFTIQEGIESFYRSIYLERCPRGNCDPRLRPKTPPGTCEGGRAGGARD